MEGKSRRDLLETVGDSLISMGGGASTAEGGPATDSLNAVDGTQPLVVGASVSVNSSSVILSNGACSAACSSPGKKSKMSSNGCKSNSDLNVDENREYRKRKSDSSEDFCRECINVERVSSSADTTKLDDISTTSSPRYPTSKCLNGSESPTMSIVDGTTPNPREYIYVTLHSLHDITINLVFLTNIYD